MERQTQIGIGATAMFTLAGLVGAVTTDWMWIGPIMGICAVVAVWGFWPRRKKNVTPNTPAVLDNRGGNYVGGDNIGSQTTVHAPITINQGSKSAPSTGTLFSTESGIARRMVQFGPNGPTIGPSEGDYRLNAGAPFLPYLRESHLTVELIDEQIKVSTDVKDKSGALVARLIQNEWEVAPPRIFARNYSKNALEVLGTDGDVVLQIKILPDRIKILGEWWDRDGRGIRIAGNGNEVAMVILSHDTNTPFPKIEPMFRYPSETHLGESVG